MLFLIFFQDHNKENGPFVLFIEIIGVNIYFFIYIKNIYKKLPDGVPMYPEDVVTEETMRDVTEEIIREKILFIFVLPL